MENRDSYFKIWKELSADKSMVFVAGPRQAGKTTFAKIIAEHFTNHLYFNWDIPSHRVKLLENPNFFEEIKLKDQSRPFIIFDEIHKYKDWKNYLKGVYDEFNGKYHFLVSGSGRLDMYQKGGDSLAGRYFLFHLLPLTIAELGKKNVQIDKFLEEPLKIDLNDDEELKAIWERLSLYSGFPEPYLAGLPTTYRRWSRTYSQQIIREDIRDLTGLKFISEIETLYMLLPSKIGSPLSITSLAETLKVSYNSVKNWLDVFERFFLIFSISPWTVKMSRAIQKERKIYLWDHPRINDAGSRFENMVAIELWRAITSWNDTGYGNFSLHFIKNKEQQEVDFLIAKDNDPLLLIEAKLADWQPSVSLKKFQLNLDIPGIQLVKQGDDFRKIKNGSQSILVAPAHQWLSRLW